jgi:Ser/Thr protein kinase RdoA (MazF antagonist)
MSNDEKPLAGGRLNQVVRIDDTVHRPAGPWTPMVHALLAHLQERDFTLGPKPLGFDGAGREILSYLPGQTVGSSLPWPDWVWDEALLAEVARATASYHRAVADFRPDGVQPWRWGPAALRPDQIVCHHDLAPYNVVVEGGQLRGIIDWDLIGPGTVRSELAFVAWQWVPLQDPAITRFFGWRTDPDLVRRLRLVLDSYGLTERTGFIDDVIARVRLNRDVMVRKAEEGDPAYARLAEEGHVAGMNMAIAFLSARGGELQASIV